MYFGLNPTHLEPAAPIGLGACRLSEVLFDQTLSYRGCRLQDRRNHPIGALRMNQRPELPDWDLDQIAEQTYSAVFSDVCDALGYRNQTVSPHIQRLTKGPTLIGWARTFVTLAVEQAPERHYGTEIDFIDGLRHGEVAVGDASGAPAAVWGELFSTAALGRRARGAMIDGLIRDLDKIKAIDFPIHATGTRPTDALGRVSMTEWDIPIQLGGVGVHPGDLVVGDTDGIAVIPAAIAEQACARAVTKATTEDDARDVLLAGGKLGDVWEKYGVL